MQTNYLGTEPYDETREGFALRMGYAFNDHLRQAWSYSLVGRTVYNVASNASFYIQDAAGYTLLSQVSQAADPGLSRQPRSIRTPAGVDTLGTDFAGLGGDAEFLRTRLDASYYIPLERLIGNPDWGIVGLRRRRLPVQPGPAGAGRSTASSWAATICAASRPAAPARTTRLRRPARRPVHLDAVHRTALPAAGVARPRPDAGAPSSMSAG